MKRSIALVATTTTTLATSSEMDCGASVPLCGVLTLESGYGDGYYQHDTPSVHGLWPQYGKYGTSLCIAPEDATDPDKIYSCYSKTNDTAHQLSFEAHEWDKHGKCAGVNSVKDFFGQICTLSSAPLQVMATTRISNPGDLEAMKTALINAKYPVWGETPHSEVLLSCCAGDDGEWKLAKVSDFPSLCKGTVPSTTPSPPPSPTPAASTCMKNVEGPKCDSNADCINVDGCVRCATSGYCTDVPLAVV